MSRTKRIPRSVLREAVKKAGTFMATIIVPALLEDGVRFPHPKDGYYPNDYVWISSINSGLLGHLESVTVSLGASGFHYSPYRDCRYLTKNDSVECWSGDVDNPTVRRHKVGNCKVEV